MKRQPINKDNYEEYFLLYVDNELTDTEKADVDEFVKQHPGLKTELQMFLDTRLDMEDVKMDGIEDLYKYEDEGMINKGNYEEFQVLMIDNELDPESQEALESFHKLHPGAAANFEWLRKTKLPDEAIVFPNKALLYRTEKKPASVISITWIRYAAAAAVILMAAIFWINNEDQNLSEPQIADRKIESEKDSKIVREGNSEIERDGSSNSLITAVPADADKKSTQGNSTGAVTVVKIVPENRNAIKPESSKLLAGENEPVKDAMASVEPQKIAAVVEKNETKISTEDLVTKAAGTVPNTTEFAQPAMAMNVKTNYASEALNGIVDEDNDEAMVEEGGKQKRGLRGIVRKANRIYNKVTNPDLDKQLVKVANFEIGLR